MKTFLSLALDFLLIRVYSVWTAVLDDIATQFHALLPHTQKKGVQFSNRGEFQASKHGRQPSAHADRTYS